MISGYPLYIHKFTSLHNSANCVILHSYKGFTTSSYFKILINCQFCRRLKSYEHCISPSTAGRLYQYTKCQNLCLVKPTAQYITELLYAMIQTVHIHTKNPSNSSDTSTFFVLYWNLKLRNTKRMPLYVCKEISHLYLLLLTNLYLAGNRRLSHCCFCNRRQRMLKGSSSLENLIYPYTILRYPDSNGG